MELKTVFNCFKNHMLLHHVLIIGIVTIFLACSGGGDGSGAVGGNNHDTGISNESELELYDDFSADQINLSKWVFPRPSNENKTREIKNDRCYLALRTDSNNPLNNSLQFADSTNISDIKMTGILREVTTRNNGSAVLRIVGAFYSDGADTDIWGSVFIGDNGTGQLIAQCRILRVYPDNTSDYIEYYRFGDISLNQEYTLSISYDGDVTFTFGFNDQVHTIQGPPRLGDPHNIIPIYKLVGLRMMNCDTESAITGEIDDVEIRRDFESSNPAEGTSQNQSDIFLQDTSELDNNNGLIVEQEPIELKPDGSEDIEAFRIKYLSDGLRVVGFIVKPREIPVNLPVIIYNRGGNREFSKITDNTLSYLSYLAANGYVVIASQYRGNDGGEGQEEFGGEDVNDVLYLIPLAKSLPFTQHDQIVMLGYSRGGMMTYLAIKNNADIKAAAIVGGVTNLGQSFNEREEAMRQVIIYLVGTDEEEWKKRSAIYWPEKLTVPILMLHGENDSRVDVSQAITLSEKLSDAGKVHALYVFENGDHRLNTHLAERNELIFDWFDTYLY